MPGLSDFSNAINERWGVQHNNRFEVRFTALPVALRSDPEMISSLLPMYCEAMTMPSRNIATAPVRVEHASYEMPYGITYEPINLSFYIDREFLIRDFLYSWYQLVYDNKLNGHGFYEEYVSKIDLIAMSREEQDNYVVTLVNAWPKSIGEVQFSSNGQGEVVTMPIQLVYEKMYESRLQPSDLNSGSVTDNLRNESW